MSDQAIHQIVARRALSPRQMRRLWARVTTLKTHLFDLWGEVRQLRADVNLLLQVNHTKIAAHRASEALAQGGQAMMDAMQEASDADYTRPCPPALDAGSWRAMEDAMVRDIEQKIEAQIRSNVGADES